MGYTTEFQGSLSFNKEVEVELVKYINTFNETRHMIRDIDKIKEIYPNWKDLCFEGDLGEDGEYLIAVDNFDDPSILNYNEPGGSAPGLWCQWYIYKNKLMWDGCEKFYHYIEWLRYLINNFFAPKGYLLNGIIRWRGEDFDDNGEIHVTNNKIEIYKMQDKNVYTPDNTLLINNVSICNILQDKEEIDDYYRLNLGQNNHDSICIYVIKNEDTTKCFDLLSIGSYVLATGHIKPEPQNVMVYVIANSIYEIKEEK